MREWLELIRFKTRSEIINCAIDKKRKKVVIWEQDDVLKERRKVLRN